MPSRDKFEQLNIRDYYSDNAELSAVANEIYLLIKKEKNLSFRKLGEIKKLLQKGAVTCLFSGNVLVGFLISHKLGKNLTEINGLYVKPQFRNNNMSSRLIEHATREKNKNYFAATFLDNVKKILESHDFEETDLKYLTLLEKFNFLKQRFKLHRIREVIRHKRTSKLSLLKKECH